MTAPVVGTCIGPGCGVEMIPQPVWHRKPELRGQYRRIGGHGMCSRCYNRARRLGTLPDPAPLPSPRAPKPPKRMTPQLAIAQLEAIDTSDREAARRAADEVLLRYLAFNSPKVTAAYEAASQRALGKRGAA